MLFDDDVAVRVLVGHCNV